MGTLSGSTLAMCRSNRWRPTRREISSELPSSLATRGTTSCTRRRTSRWRSWSHRTAGRSWPRTPTGKRGSAGSGSRRCSRTATSSSTGKPTSRLNRARTGYSISDIGGIF
uniref:(northern house mosquito) hypothetical protein n=1 Tax=Culex pipiens TaxID=7175 RepID=A0A8D8KC58_CULPI